MGPLGPYRESAKAPGGETSLPEVPATAISLIKLISRQFAMKIAIQRHR